MNAERLENLLGAFKKLRIAVVGDFCLDRYLELDALHREVSIETGLPVYKVDHVRSQPGAAGTVLKNLVAMGVGSLYPIGFCGDDGEGFELKRALAATAGVSMVHFLCTEQRRTFTYCKPLLLSPGELPRELSRLDSKNLTPTPGSVSQSFVQSLHSLSDGLDAVAVMDQVDTPGTGVVTPEVLKALASIQLQVPVLADSRSGLGTFPPLVFKLNRDEMVKLAGLPQNAGREEISVALRKLAVRNHRPAFVTLAEEGILGALPDTEVCWRPCLPLRGPIDVVGAGDSVTAALVAALAAGSSLEEALELAMLAASVTVHQVGTTGEARVEWMLALARD